MSDILSLFFYISTFCLSGLLLYIGLKRNSKLAVGLSLVIPILVAGMRLNVGTDYASYERMYLSFLDTGVSDYVTNNTFNIEPGFFLLIKLGQMITSEPYIIFLLSAILTITFFYFGLKNVDLKNKALYWFLYLMIIFPLTFNATRQGIAASIGFLALTYLAKNKPMHYILLTLLAVCFHTSALVLFLAYPVLKLLMRKKDVRTPNRFLIKSFLVFGLIIASLPVFVQLAISIESLERYAGYTDYVSGVSLTTILFKIGLMGVVVYFFSRVVRKYEVAFIYLVFALLELITLGLWFSSAAIFRISFYFAPFSLLLLVYSLDVVKDRKSKRLLTAGYIVFAALYFYVAYYMAGQAEIIPYQFVII